MFPWSKKITKPVTFNSEVADDTLLAVVETELMKQPHKTFSDLCKEALWQFLCVPESVRPTTPKAGQMEQPVAELKRQLAEFEQRFLRQESSRWEAIEPKLNQLLRQESSRLDAIERQLNQLSGQLAQLSLIVNQQPKSESSRPFVPEVKQAETVTSTAPPAEIDDPLLNRLSAFLDDF
ncbi:plasmid segregation centromere-binding protein ParR [Allocoleopsis sp.]|uniref:plasmid segregation centromere-binding protein ParR n=1 Tax=Allocoleopsis sp. TaxID=3088169 RepID=UPI002FE74E10